MAAITHRIDFFLGHDVEAIRYSENGKLQAFDQHLKAEKRADFEQLVLDHRMLHLENDVYREYLVNNFHTFTDEEKRIKINNALKYAELLEIIYRYYLTVDRVANRYKQEQALYRDWLNAQKTYPDENTPVDELSRLSRDIRTGHELVNFWRLLAVRTRRLLLLLIPVLSDFPFYKKFINALDVVCGPIAQHQGWIFFIPRLSTNLALTMRHAFLSMMNDQERSLNPVIRFRAQMDFERRWWELANDIGWFSSNISTAFIFTGDLISYAFYPALLLPLYDTIVASLRAYVEINRLNRVVADNQSDPNYLTDLHRRMDFEIAQLNQRIIVNFLLFMSMAMAISFIAVTPVVPMLGALLSVTVTIVNRMLIGARPNPESLDAQADLRQRLQDVLYDDKNQTARPAIKSGEPLKYFGLFAPDSSSAREDTRNYSQPSLREAKL